MRGRPQGSNQAAGDSDAGRSPAGAAVREGPPALPATVWPDRVYAWTVVCQGPPMHLGNDNARFRASPGDRVRGADQAAVDLEAGRRPPRRGGSRVPTHTQAAYLWQNLSYFRGGRLRGSAHASGDFAAKSCAIRGDESCPIRSAQGVGDNLAGFRDSRGGRSRDADQEVRELVAGSRLFRRGRIRGATHTAGDSVSRSGLL